MSKQNPVFMRGLAFRKRLSIYDANGEFVKNGSMGKTKKFSSPSFSNVSLMNGYTVKNIVAAGVSYTIHCTRSINITVYMQFY